MTLANSADSDQTPQNVASDQGLHCLFKIQEVKSLNEMVLHPHSGLFFQPTLRQLTHQCCQYFDCFINGSKSVSSSPTHWIRLQF